MFDAGVLAELVVLHLEGIDPPHVVERRRDLPGDRDQQVQMIRRECLAFSAVEVDHPKVRAVEPYRNAKNVVGENRGLFAKCGRRDFGIHLERVAAKRGGLEILRVRPRKKHRSSLRRNLLEDLPQHLRQHRLAVGNVFNRGADLIHRVDNRPVGQDLRDQVAIDMNALDWGFAHAAGTITQAGNRRPMCSL